MVRTHFKSDKPQRTPRKARGYALHDRRIALAGEIRENVQAIRTVKFPLAAEESEADYQRLADDIASDVRNLYGPTSYSAWFEASVQESPSYSFLDLWLDALSLGGVFQENAADIWRLGKAVVGNDPVPRFIEKVEAKLKSEYSGLVNLEALYAFCTTDQRPKVGRNPCDVVFEDKKSVAVQRLISDLKPKFESLHTTFKESKTTKEQKAFKKLLLFAHAEESELHEIFPRRDEGEDLSSESARSDLALTFLIVPSLTPLALPNLCDLWCSSRGERIHQIVANLTAHNRAGLFGSGVKPEILLGLGKNAFSHFGGRFLEALRERAGPALLANLMVQRLGSQSAFAGEIERRLALLRERVLLLPDRPMLQSNWGDYRSDVGGKLSSWYSNQANYATRIREHLDKTSNELARRTPLLKAGSDVQGAKKNRVEELLKDTQKIADSAVQLTEGTNGFFSGEFRAVYDQLLVAVADLNTAWNEYEQSLKETAVSTKQSTKKTRRKSDDEDDEKVTPRISLPKFPAFFGDELRIRFARFRESPALLALLLSTFRDALKQVAASRFEEGAEEELAKTAQRLLIPFRRLSSQTSSVRSWLLADSRLECVKGIRRNEGFYCNPRARKKFPVLPAPTATELCAVFTSLTEWVDRILGDWLSEQGVSNPELLRAAIQTTATVISLSRETDGLKPFILKLVNQCAMVNLSSSREPAFPRLRSFWNVLATNSRQLENFDRLLSVICAEASGLVSLCSRQTILERYAFQAINGQQTHIFAAEDNGISRFAVGFPKWKDSPKTGIAGEYPTLFLKAQETVCEEVKRNRDGSGSLAQFRIQSSTYQLQFLRWAWKQPQSKKCSLTMGGGFLIAETPVTLSVKDGYLVPERLPRPKVFISQPFEMKPLKWVVAKQDAVVAAGGFSNDTLMGVDVGEYGLAFSVVRRSEQDGVLRLDLIDSGVLLNGTHRVLRDKVHKLKKRQRTGVFSSSDTSIAGAREALIGSYTNRLHALALHHRARLVFEFNISVFEAGGNRIKTVYDTIKRADVPPRGDAAAADKSRQSHVWGSKNLGTGEEVGASGTSQTCAKCRRWFADDLDTLNDDDVAEVLRSARVLDHEGHYLAHEAEVNGSKLRFFIDRSARESFVRIDKEGFRRAIKAYLRPPLWRLGKNVLPKRAKGRRGNSAAFRCPYSDCGHHSDADVQAAFNVAARAFLRSGKLLDGDSRWTNAYRRKVKETAPPKLERRYFQPVGR